MRANANRELAQCTGPEDTCIRYVNPRSSSATSCSVLLVITESHYYSKVTVEASLVEVWSYNVSSG